MSDLISRQAAIDAANNYLKLSESSRTVQNMASIYEVLQSVPPAELEIIRCWECKHNPKDTWFECPMSHLNERQRPEDAWCFRGERRTDGNA